MASNNVTEKIFNLRTEVLRFASAKDHTHPDVYTKTEIDAGYAPINHASSTKNHGEADTTNYGHVKLASAITDNADGVPNAQTVKDYVDDISTITKNDIDSTFGTGPNDTDGRIYQTISAYDITSKLKRYSVASTYQVPNDYKTTNIKINDTVNDADPAHIKAAKLDDITKPLYVTPGHYHITPDSDDAITYKIVYNGQDKYYANGLLDVKETYGTNIIQNLYTTEKNGNQYELTGEIYTRKGVWTASDEITFNGWKPLFIPKQNIDIDNTMAVGIKNMSVEEGTAGYIIRWDNGDPYTLEKARGEWQVIGQTVSQLNIGDGEYHFPNFMGNFDIKIVNTVDNGTNCTQISIQSKEVLGHAIDSKYLIQNYFIPRMM